jgi:2',3'-cyclic-nucleotide 2'-phosphodiesterase (5'-nucleotidase family)
LFDSYSFSHAAECPGQGKKIQELTNRDAGDHHDGSGLVSSSPTSAKSADEIFNMLQYDVLTIGNHELYAYDSARWVYDNKARLQVHLCNHRGELMSSGGRYLTSNVEIEVDGVMEVVGDRFTKFGTEQ